jgi:tRNA threonylcarbamoyladenosine biosynthesis protein TsaB
MTILALEFSSARRGVALVRDGRLLAEATHTMGRSTPTFSLIERVLAEAQAKREAVECVAVGIGPGSYTGVRLAISVAQGWHLATGARLAAVSSFDALAFRAASSGSGPISFIADAQRNEFALATAEPAPTTTGFRWVIELRLEAHETVSQRLKNGERMAGPIDGLAARGGLETWPTAGDVGRLAELRGEFVAPTTLAPIYLREASFVKAPAPRAAGLPSER